MKRLKIIWILHKPVIVTFIMCMVLALWAFVCGAMAGFEQGQISVASGQVTCFKSVSEWVCEEVK